MPRREEVRYLAGEETIEADLYLPGDAGRHAGLVVENGISPEGRRYPALVGLGQALARAGVVALIADSPDYLAGRATPAEIGRLEAALDEIARRPEVRPDRIGVFGVSVGGSLALVAASAGHPWARRLRVLATAGQYYSIESVLQVATTETYQSAAGLVPYHPEAWVWQAGRNTAIAALPDSGDRAKLAAAFAGPRPLPNPAEPSGLTPAGQAMFHLLANRDPRQVEPLLRRLPPEQQAWLEALSPAPVLASVHVPVLILVDEADTYFPAEESRRVAAALDGRARLTVVAILAHVELEEAHPNPGQLVIFYLPQVFRLWRYVVALLWDLA